MFFVARLPEKFMAFPDELEENQSVSLVCSADVGSPWGTIKIWKISQYSDKPELIYTSNSTNNKINNCTELINVTTTYTVTRDDNGAIFRCSSQNNLTRGPGPSKDSQNIYVSCRYKNGKVILQMLKFCLNIIYRQTF